MVREMNRLFRLGITFVLVVAFVHAEPSRLMGDESSPRYLVITDMTHDDPQSLIRLLLYSSEIEIAGIIVTNQRKDHDQESEVPWRSAIRVLEAYGKVEGNLRLHDPRYPSIEYLKSISRRHSGAPTISFAESDDRFDDYIGTGDNKDGKPKSTEATLFLKRLFADDDPRPIHVGLWGGAVAFVQALWEYRGEVEPAVFDALLKKLYVYDVAAQDVTNDFLVDMNLLNQAFLGYGKSTYQGERPMVASYACFKNWGIYLGADYIDESIIRHVGGGLTASYGGGGEGDSPSFFHLVSSLYGLNDPTNLEEASWGGHFRSAPEIGANVMVESSESPKALKSYMAAARNDFYARAERATKAVGKVNRNPLISVNGDSTARPLRLKVKQGEIVKVDVSGSRDPDGDSLRLTWREDFCAASRSGPALELKVDAKSNLEVVMPDGATNEIHLVLTGEDDGEPNLTGYRRVILVPLPDDSAQRNVVLQGRVFGMGKPFDDKATFKNAFDGDLSTYVDHHQTAIQFVALDLGEPTKRERRIRQIRYYPRPGFEFRMIDGEFHGANERSFEKYEVLHQVKRPVAGWNSVSVDGGDGYRYLRYVGPQGGFANVAEIEFVAEQ